MKIKIIKWELMTWYSMNRKNLEGKELEVIKEVESQVYPGKKSYLLFEPNHYIPARNCEIIVP